MMGIQLELYVLERVRNESVKQVQAVKDILDYISASSSRKLKLYCEDLDTISDLLDGSICGEQRGLSITPHPSPPQYNLLFNLNMDMEFITIDGFALRTFKEFKRYYLTNKAVFKYGTLMISAPSIIFNFNVQRSQRKVLKYMCKSQGLVYESVDLEPYFQKHFIISTQPTVLVGIRITSYNPPEYILTIFTIQVNVKKRPQFEINVTSI